MTEHGGRVDAAIEAGEGNTSRVPAGTNLVEWYFEQGWTDGLPVVPPTRAAVDAVVAALGATPTASSAGCRRGSAT